jgi:hypothetical protein
MTETPMRMVWSVIAAVALIPSSAFGWGCEGHQIVALIARAHLTPAASAAVDRLLHESPIDPKQERYCKDRPADLMADSATWADDARTIEKTSTWHYIDIPLSVREGSAMKWCEPIGGSVNDKQRPGCIVSAIEFEWRILRDATRPASDRAKALRYVIHFMGDLSQPLHDSDNHDQGGNCATMRFFGDAPPERLHAIWDYRIVAHDLAAKNTTQQQYAATLDKTFAKHWRAWGESKTTLEPWAWEGHKLAVSVVYGQLKPTVPIEPVTTEPTDRSTCDAERTKVEALHIQIGQEYVDQAVPVIQEQLAKAGYRLAGLLNQTLR